MKLIGSIRTTATGEVRQTEFEMPTYEMARAAIEAVVSEGEQLIALRRG
jgi:hypothetical protein